VRRCGLLHLEATSQMAPRAIRAEHLLRRWSSNLEACGCRAKDCRSVVRWRLQSRGVGRWRGWPQREARTF